MQKTILIETSMLKRMMEGESIILLAKMPVYTKGQVLGVKETYRYDGGEVYFAADEDVKPGDYEIPESEWMHGNSLPEVYIKRHVSVTDIKITSKSMYETVLKQYCIPYNKRVWIVPCTLDKPDEFKTIYNSKSVLPEMNDRIWMYELTLIKKG